MSVAKYQHNRGGHLVGLVTTMLAVSVALLILLNRQYIVDTMTVWQYQPDAAIARMASRTDMTDKGKFYFHASRPAVLSNQSFNDKCTRKEKSAAILGCYNGSRIFIYDVTDQRLDGIKSVTAAHEMLHAAYDRLSDGEKERINELLEKEYESLKGDVEFSERMAFYARTEPGERSNELHSVIGTEVDVVDDELEKYYGQYFNKRHRVVALHENYASVFTDLQQSGAKLVSQLNGLSVSIKKDSARYNAQVSQLNQDITDFNARAESNNFASQASFQSERASLLQRADELDQMRDTVNQSIARYDDLQKKLARVSSQSEALNRSIDSSLAPAPSL